MTELNEQTVSAVTVFKLKPKTIGFKEVPNRNRIFLVAM